MTHSRKTLPFVLILGALWLLPACARIEVAMSVYNPEYADQPALVRPPGATSRSRP